MLKSNIL